MSGLTSPRASSSSKPNPKPKPKRVHAELPDDIVIPDVIERLPKPDKTAHEAELSTLNAKIKTIQERMNVIRTEMDSLKSGRGGYGEQIQAAKAVFTSLKNDKDRLVQQRNHYTNQIKQQLDKKENSIKANRNARSNLRFHTVEEYDQAIQTLRHQQETRSMSLNEEKNLVKEMEHLQRQKTQVVSVVDNKDEVEQFNDSIKEMRVLQQQKNTEIDVLQEKLTQQKQQLDTLYKLNEEEKQQDKFPILAKERKTLKEELDTLFTSIKAKRLAFQQANDKYYENIRLVRKKKELERKKEEEVRLLEFQTKLAEFEKEMAKIHPYQDELDLCDALLTYLQQTYAKELKEDDKDKLELDATNKKIETLELDGLKPLERKEEDFMAFTGTKKGKKKGGKIKTNVREVKLSLPMAKLESFATIGLLPPSTVSALMTSLKAIQEKRKWFQEQTTRAGTTSTTPSSATTATVAVSPKKTKNTKKFNGADTNAFPSLGGADVASSSTTGGWGPGMTPPAAPSTSYNLADEYEVIEAQDEE